MLFGSIMMVVFWGGIIVLVVLAVRWLGSGAAGLTAAAPAKKTALEILEERFARGEIDKEEYQERRRLLSE
jgi:putative membrane protein